MLNAIPSAEALGYFRATTLADSGTPTVRNTFSPNFAGKTFKPRHLNSNGSQSKCIRMVFSAGMGPWRRSPVKVAFHVVRVKVVLPA